MGANGDSSQRPNGSYALGDLDLDLAPPAAAPRPQPAQAPAAPKAARTGGSAEIDLDDVADPAGHGLAVDHGTLSNDNWRGRTDHFAQGGRDVDPLGQGDDLPLPELDHSGGPSRLSGTASQRRAQEAEAAPARRAEKLASYGATPTNLWASVPYCVTVVKRKLALAQERKRLVGKLAELNAQLPEALVGLGRDLASQPAEQLTPVKVELDAVLAAGSTAEQADQSAARARQRLEADLSVLDQHIAELRARAEPREQAAALAQTHHERTCAARKKAEAMLSRIDIELRALETAQAPADPARVNELHEMRVERQEQQEQARAAAGASAQALDDAKRGLEAAQGEVDRATGQRRKLIDQATAAQRKLTHAAQGAEGELAEKLRALARAACLTGIDALAGETSRRVRDLDRHYAQGLESKHLYDLALRGYDRGAFWRGIGLLAASLAAALGAALSMLS